MARKSSSLFKQLIFIARWH